MPSTAPTAAEELSCTAGPQAWEKMAADDSTASFTTERSALTHPGVYMQNTPEALCDAGSCARNLLRIANAVHEEADATLLVCEFSRPQPALASGEQGQDDASF